MPLMILIILIYMYSHQDKEMKPENLQSCAIIEFKEQWIEK
jgi:hypothetical protein